jgi:hypothetical protein
MRPAAVTRFRFRAPFPIQQPTIRSPCATLTVIRGLRPIYCEPVKVPNATRRYEFHITFRTDSVVE